MDSAREIGEKKKKKNLCCIGKKKKKKQLGLPLKHQY